MSSGQLALSTGAVGTTQAVTGLGFQPKAILFWWSGTTATATGQAGGTYRRGFGAATSPTARWAVASTTVDAAATIDSGRAQRNDALFCTAQSNPSGVDALVDLNSIDADGFTLIVDDQLPSAYTLHWLAFGGTDITNVAVGNFAGATATGNASVTGVGFQPDVVLVASAGLTTAPPSSSSSRSNMMLACAQSSTRRWVWYGGNGAEGAVTSNSFNYCRTGEFMCIVNDGGTSVSWRSDFVSMDAGGFTYNVTTSDAAARQMWYLAIKGGSWDVGSILTQTDTTTPSVVSGLAFAPAGVLAISHAAAASTAGTLQAHDRLSIGAATASVEYAQATYDQDNLADVVAATGLSTSDFYRNISDGTLNGAMTMQSLDSGGFTAIMSDADPAQAIALYLTGGSSATGSTGTAALTEASDTASASGAAAIAGLAALSEASDTLASAGAAALSAQAVLVEVSDTLASAGAVAVTGAGAQAETDDTLAAAGTVGSAGVTASATLVEADDTATGAGVVRVAGTAALPGADAALVSTGAIRVTGTASLIAVGEAVTAMGAVVVTGAATLAEAGDVLTATGAVAVTGAAALTETSDTLISTGMVASTGSATGTMALPEADDAVSAIGAVQVTGASALIEASDTVAAIGSISAAALRTISLTRAPRSAAMTRRDRAAILTRVSRSAMLSRRLTRASRSATLTGGG